MGGGGVGTGYFTGPFVVRVAMLFGEMFFRLTMLPYPPHEGDRPPLVYSYILTLTNIPCPQVTDPPSVCVIVLCTH